MTTQGNLDVVGIGNALVDVLSHEADGFIDEHGLVRGAMTLIDAERAEELYAAMGPGTEMSGGSAANTIAGIASFGGQAGYLGRVADDQLGAVFGHDLRAQGVTYTIKPATDGVPTGRCLIVVTADGQRTMNTFLGSSAFFGPGDVDEDLVSSAQVTFLEGYLFDRPDSMEAYWLASKVATDAGRKVALTLSDLFCVERHHDAFLPLVRERVDILFANETEAEALWQVDDVEHAIDEHISSEENHQGEDGDSGPDQGDDPEADRQEAPEEDHPPIARSEFEHVSSFVVSLRPDTARARKLHDTNASRCGSDRPDVRSAALADPFQAVEQEVEAELELGLVVAPAEGGVGFVVGDLQHHPG